MQSYYVPSTGGRHSTGSHTHAESRHYVWLSIDGVVVVVPVLVPYRYMVRYRTRYQVPYGTVPGTGDLRSLEEVVIVSTRYQVPGTWYRTGTRYNTGEGVICTVRYEYSRT